MQHGIAISCKGMNLFGMIASTCVVILLTILPVHVKW